MWVEELCSLFAVEVGAVNGVVGVAAVCVGWAAVFVAVVVDSASSPSWDVLW